MDNFKRAHEGFVSSNLYKMKDASFQIGVSRTYAESTGELAQFQGATLKATVARTDRDDVACVIELQSHGIEYNLPDGETEIQSEGDSRTWFEHDPCKRNLSIIRWVIINDATAIAFLHINLHQEVNEMIEILQIMSENFVKPSD